MLGNRVSPEARSCLCVCGASVLTTFATGGVPHAGSRQLSTPHLFGLFLYLFLGTLGFWCSTQAFSSCGKWELLSSCSAQVFHSDGFTCFGAPALESGLNLLWCLGLVAIQHVDYSCTRDWTLSPALTGGFFTTGPPKNSLTSSFLFIFSNFHSKEP